jgi:UDP-glucuronate 4-epimerase
MKILVTGCAGFIGFHLTKRLLAKGHDVVGIDNLNNYYDVSLKEARLEQLAKYRDSELGTRDSETQRVCPNPEFRVSNSGSFAFIKMDISDRAAMEKLFAGSQFDRVIHLAAQAGVRYSITNPHAYVNSNLVGFLNILEGCRNQWTGLETRNSGLEKSDGSSESRIPNSESRHLVYASSSSVYGSNTKLPFSVSDNVDHPISLYAATKKANELMAHTYSHLYGIPTTGLRFFTVYGPWGRPDMALFKFTKAILAGEPIDVFNNGDMQRDFTYIDDIVEGIVRVTDKVPGLGTRNSELGTPEGSSESRIPNPESRYRLYNIGNHSPVGLMDFIKTLEDALGIKAKVNLRPLQAGDVPATYADVDDLMRDVGFKPSTTIKDGIAKFVEWWRQHYGRMDGPR